MFRCCIEGRQIEDGPKRNQRNRSRLTRNDRMPFHGGNRGRTYARDALDDCSVESEGLSSHPLLTVRWLCQWKWQRERAARSSAARSLDPYHTTSGIYRCG